MVELCLKLYVLCNGEWVDSSAVLQYDAATLDALCLQIGETLFRRGWITQIDGVKVDSYFGVVTNDWRRVLTFADIPTPQAKLRIVQENLHAAGPTGSGQKRGIDAVAGGAEETKSEHKLAKCVHDDGAAGPTGSGQKRGIDG
jgi:hypothetical protein